MEKELISVLIPVLEENNLLLSCLQTIFEQDYPNIEIIISTKHEKINLGNFANDSRIRVIYTSEDDLAMMRSKAVEQAKGEFIVFLDPRGGLVGQGALTRMFYFIEEKNLDVFISNLTEFANNIFRIETGKNDILEEINPINYYFYLKKFREL
ncbi:glycosyltransferase family 2 protein, partial [Ligilactobacillus agilis]|uniref:glycosyltransferase family 2 protein n=1 Tax=Ligilactobacillus agilis TaxID=1601 RepID=UPI001558DAC4